MTSRIASVAMAVACGAISVKAQNSTPEQRLSSIRQSVAENQRRLRDYQWVETTEIRIKGDLKTRKQSECRCGADGLVHKTPIGAPSEAKKPGGLRGKLATGKIEEMHDYTERLGRLVTRYVPPRADAMQSAFKSGKASLDASSGQLRFKDFAKSGDQVTYSFDSSAKMLRGIEVATYLDSPQDTVHLEVTFTPLPDGTNALSQSVVESKAKELQIKHENSDYKKVTQ
jgi:hypothetical protein